MTSLVFLHGASGNAASWAPVLPAFDGVPVVALDLPGRGTTPGPARDTVAGLASWLVGALAERGIVRPILVGHSLGGAVGLQAALDAPGALGGLGMVASSARLKVAPVILEAVRNATTDNPYRLDLAFGASTERTDIQAYAAAIASVPPASAVADWQACDAFDVRARLGEVAVPTLVVFGSADPLTPAKHQRALAAAVPGASAVEVPGAGHMLPWEAPAALAAAIRAWRSSLPFA